MAALANQWGGYRLRRPVLVYDFLDRAVDIRPQERLGGGLVLAELSGYDPLRSLVAGGKVTPLHIPDSVTKAAYRRIKARIRAVLDSKFAPCKLDSSDEI